MKTLVPNRLLFRFEFSLSYRRKPPKIDGKLSGWGAAELLPALGEMDGEASFAPVWSCWSESGLYIATQVTGKRSPLRCNPKEFWKGDNLRLMLDMRDARNIKRATKFCHHFYFLPVGGSPRSEPGAPGSPRSEPGAPAMGQRAAPASRRRAQNSEPTRRSSPLAASAPINRAKEHSPAVERGRIRVASTVTSDG